MSIHKPTPILTHHARQRCAEMGVKTRTAKRIVQNPSLTRPSPGSTGQGHERMAYSDEHPDLAVIYTEGVDGKPPVIVTVLYYSYEPYERGQAAPPCPRKVAS